MQNEDKNKSASELSKAGNKVSGTPEQTDENPENQKSDNTDTNWGNDDMPDESNKKDNMSGYNELPEQSKVGGE